MKSTGAARQGQNASADVSAAHRRRAAVVAVSTLASSMIGSGRLDRTVANGTSAAAPPTFRISGQTSSRDLRAEDADEKDKAHVDWLPMKLLGRGATDRGHRPTSSLTMSASALPSQPQSSKTRFHNQIPNWCEVREPG